MQTSTVRYTSRSSLTGNVEANLSLRLRLVLFPSRRYSSPCAPPQKKSRRTGEAVSPLTDNTHTHTNHTQTTHRHTQTIDIT